MNRFSTLWRFGFFLVALMAAGYTLHAQSPRMVVIEEATNASCGPCAAQNPYFEAWLDQHKIQERVIPVIYRADYPGSDVMNAANPTMHNGRVTYYSDAAKNLPNHITGVPTAMVNGIIPTCASYPGQPSDVQTLESKVMAAPTTSPITLEITDTRTNLNGNVTVKVSTMDAISSKTLQVVLVEGYHYYAAAGSNGEKEFKHIARQMFPTQDGTTLNIAAGSSQSFQFSYTIDASWNAGQMYIVAFVQDDNTREILQGATNQGKVSMEAPNGLIKVQTTDATSSSITANVTTNNSAKYLVNITSTLPSGWTATTTLNSNAVKSGDSVSLDASSSNTVFNVGFNIPNGAKPGKGTVTVTLSGDRGAQSSQVFKLYSGKADVLVMLKDEGGVATIPDRYDKGMAKVTGMPYLLVDRGDEGLFTWKDYKVVVYEVGKSVVVKGDVDMLKTYMDNGGRLFLTGAEITWGLADPGATGYYQDIPFVTNYLHCSYVGDTGPNFTIYGGSGDPIGNGMQFSIASGVHTGSNNTPDVISARPESKAFLYYGPEANKSVAGIRYSNPNYRLVYMGFGLEEITDDNVRGTLLQRGIDWLLGSEITSGVRNETVTIGDMTVEGIRPNPAGSTVELPLSLAAPAHVSVNVYNAQGSLIGSATDKNYEAGHSVVRYNVSTLPTGVYSFVVSVNGKNTVRQVAVTH